MEIKFNLRTNPKRHIFLETSVEIGRLRVHLGYVGKENFQFALSRRFPNEIKRRVVFFCYLSNRMREIAVRGKWIHRSYYRVETKKWVSEKNPNTHTAP
jgi:hypothetical protein